MQKKRLALFFDGTWNDPRDDTNVWRLKSAAAATGADAIPQATYYDPGVGTNPLDRVSGGAFGVGLSKNVRDGYHWLMQNYQPGDEILLFGFSRGAFTARSLAGVVARCGLLMPDAPLTFMDVYKRYKKGDNVAAIYDLKYFGAKPQNSEDEVIRDRTYYGRSFIKMVGVWDTVGSLGIPFGRIQGVSASTLRFHYTRLSRTVEHSYQALALDEYRKPYRPELWTNFVREGDDPEKLREGDKRFIEQRWFAGAHSNVGGGYRNDLLPQRPLAWIQQKATDCGLKFQSPVQIEPDYIEDLQTPPTDSYAKFLLGTWRFLTFGQRSVRTVMAEATFKPSKMVHGRETTAGWVYPANERIDLSVFRRCQLDSKYRPRGLMDWAKHKNIELGEIIAKPEKYEKYWSPVILRGIEPSAFVHTASM